MDQDDKRSREGARGRDQSFSELAEKAVRLAWQDAPPPAAAEMSPGIVGAVAMELRARGRRRRMVRWAGASFAGTAVAIVTILVGVRYRRASPPVNATAAERALSHNGSGALASGVSPRLLVVGGDVDARGRSTTPDRLVGAGDSFAAGASRPVRISSAAGTELMIEPGGILRVIDASATDRFLLVRGAVHVRVAKLLPNERFIIQTSDTEVEVHGTQFRVSLVPSSTKCAAGALVTHVSVSEGVVSVGSAGDRKRLFPNDEWSSRCTTTLVSRGPSADADQKSRRRSARGMPSVVTASRLAAQNDLFASAVRARRNGHVQDALARFERFARRYPDSSLIESALVHRMRLLAESDRGAAVAAATAYLARFPDGFARTEAHLLSDPTTNPQ